MHRQHLNAKAMGMDLPADLQQDHGPASPAALSVLPMIKSGQVLHARVALPSLSLPPPAPCMYTHFSSTYDSIRACMKRREGEGGRHASNIILTMA